MHGILEVVLAVQIEQSLLEREARWVGKGVYAAGLDMTDIVLLAAGCMRKDYTVELIVEEDVHMMMRTEREDLSRCIE